MLILSRQCLSSVGDDYPQYAMLILRFEAVKTILYMTGCCVAFFVAPIIVQIILLTIPRDVLDGHICLSTNSAMDNNVIISYILKELEPLFFVPENYFSP